MIYMTYLHDVMYLDKLKYINIKKFNSTAVIGDNTLSKDTTIMLISKSSKDKVDVFLKFSCQQIP